MDPVLEAIEESTRALAAFRTQYDQRFDRLEAKMFNRAGNAGGSIEVAGGAAFNTPEVKAFRTYLQTGDSGALKAEHKAMNSITGDASGGGFAVPKVIADQIEMQLLKYGQMRKVSTIVRTSTSDFHHLTGLPQTTGSTWVGETDARGATTTPTLQDIAPVICEEYANPMITQRLLDDAFFNLETWLSSVIANQFASNEGYSFLLGASALQPVGLLTYPTAATGDDTRPFGTIQYLPTGVAGNFVTPTASVSPFDVLQAMIFAMKPQYRAGASWLMNSLTLAQLATVKDAQGRFILIPSQIPGFPPTIAGLPVLEDQWMPPVAAGNYPIALISKHAYLIVDRLPLLLLRDPFTAKPYITFYSTKRVGGALMNDQAVKLLKVAAA